MKLTHRLPGIIVDMICEIQVAIDIRNERGLSQANGENKPR